MSDPAIDLGSHATAMDRMYRLTRHVYDASRKYYLLGRDRLIDDLDPAPGARVLEVGCGTARNLIAIARRHPATRLYGFDISEEMLKTARANVAAAGLVDRITLVRADATTFAAATTFGVAGFDRVCFSYTLSMIPDWRGAVAAGLAALAPGGRLAAVDFGPADRLPGLARRLLWRWLGLFHVTPRLDLADLLAGHAAATGRPLRIEAPRLGYAQYLVLG